MESCRRHRLQEIVVVLIFSTIAMATAQTTWRLPATIEALQNIKGEEFETGAGQLRGVLYVGEGNAFTIKKGERFLMTKIGSEGGCRIEFKKKSYEASSCPWLEGFRDHEEDFFKVISGR